MKFRTNTDVWYSDDPFPRIFIEMDSDSPERETRRLWLPLVENESGNQVELDERNLPIRANFRVNKNGTPYVISEKELLPGVVWFDSVKIEQSPNTEVVVNSNLSTVRPAYMKRISGRLMAGALFVAYLPTESDKVVFNVGFDEIEYKYKKMIMRVRK